MHKIFSDQKKVSLSRGESIAVEGRVCLIASGVVGQYAVASNGEKLLFGFKAGEIFPLHHSSQSGSSQRRYIFKALSRVELHAMSTQDFQHSLNDPSKLREFTDCLMNISNHQMERIDNLQEERALPRLAERLMYIAYRFGTLNGDAAQINTPMSHADLAASINTSRETVNRHMRLLEDMGLVSFKKRMIRIHSVAGIQKIIELPNNQKSFPRSMLPSMVALGTVSEAILQHLL